MKKTVNKITIGNLFFLTVSSQTTTTLDINLFTKKNYYSSFNIPFHDINKENNNAQKEAAH